MTFTVHSYSIAEDWVQAICSFEHEYSRLTSTTPFKYKATFKGCCRLSDLEVNADTSWSLSTVLNVRDDDHSPRLTVLPLQTLVKKQRPGDAEPSLYLPADDNVFGDPATSAAPLLKTNKCNPADARPACAGTLPSSGSVAPLAPGLYNAVVQLKQGNSTAPVEVMIRVVEEDVANGRILPVLSSAPPSLFYPSYSHRHHVAYLGFPVRPFQVTAATALQGVHLG
eukprot:CAMPEP_0181344680 /NCGR_PEP_ID=MMETSP1101-20121128/32315_1 /TAXON_ID=46948 /ORGANISM="Rhodomonas abbreviata, Strain Caron Lab Isolate" /LENGTH=224 /DNA_ID=CAMNT_0023456525 /DNA_START=676 /DNA_END=1347 /DNA_ORIENTATION=+